jgi:diguanylate cyclase (GGDEF)-like protein
MDTDEDLIVTDADRAEARISVHKASRGSTIGGITLVAVMSVAAAMVAPLLDSSVHTGPALVVAALTTLFAVPVLVSFSRVATAKAIRSSAVSTANERQMQGEARRREFETHLNNELDMADSEPEVLATVERAVATTLPTRPVELLLADNSHAHLARMVVSSPTGEPPGCTVDSPDQCPAARRSQVQRFADSDELGVCPKLRGRPQGRCSAICVPVSIMGRTVGVIHATGEPGAVADDLIVQDLQTLANQAGARLGMHRIMAETQLQAATDNLTGLLNRRSLENQVRVLRNDRVAFTVAMADLDHFKELNDTYGHETGDRALRLFADTLRNSLRERDLVCRHGGEEFAVVLPDCAMADARQTLDGVRRELADALRAAGLPRYTASFGVIEADPNEDFEAAVRRADTALFEAKHHGRDRVVAHDGTGTTLNGTGAKPRANGRPRRRVARTAPLRAH